MFRWSMVVARGLLLMGALGALALGHQTQKDYTTQLERIATDPLPPRRAGEGIVGQAVDAVVLPMQREMMEGMSRASVASASAGYAHGEFTGVGIGLLIGVLLPSGAYIIGKRQTT